MHSNNQHGRQPLPQQTAPPTDPRTRNLPPPTSTAEVSGICRDFIWGICTMGAQCKYRHDLEYEAMKSVLKFCHDHQNRTGCTRSDCTYLHTSREEENLFLTAGTIPRLLYDRYITMASASGSATEPVPAPVTALVTAPVTAPLPAPAPLPTPAPVSLVAASESVQSAPAHNMMYEYIAQPPPPPPPPPHSHSPSSRQSAMQPPMMTMQPPMLNHMQAPMQGPMQAPMQGPMQAPLQGPMQAPLQGPMQAPMQSPIQAPMQGPMHSPMQGPMQGPMSVPMPVPAPLPPNPAPMPPPPPPPPSSSMKMAISVFSGTLPPHQNMSTHYHAAIRQQSLPAMFDPTRPPPPLPQSSTSRGLKRSAEDCEAGPSKLRKTDSSNDSSCESCVQRLIRIELYNQQIEQLQQENEQARADIANKTEDYERKKQVLKSVVGPEMYRRMLEIVENISSSPVSQWSEMFPHSNMFINPMASAANSNNTMVHQLIDMLMGNNTRGIIDPMPSSSSSDDALLHQLSARSRPNNGSADVMSTLLDLIRNVSERSTPGESRSSDPELRLSASASSNGFNRFMADSASTSGSIAGRFASGRPYGDLGAGPSNITASARSYGDGAVGPASLTPSIAGPAPIRPYPESALVPANPHPYADNRPGPAGAPYADCLPGSLARPMYADNVVGGPRYPSAQAAPPRQYHPGLCESATLPTNAQSVSAPPMYMPGSYSSPTQLPATRPFYGHGQQGLPSNNIPNPPYPGVVMSQAPRPPMPPQNAQTNPYFMGVRYPNQHYYPPYQ